MLLFWFACFFLLFYIAIGSYLTKRGRNSVLKLSAEGKRRHFLEHLFNKLEVIRPPYRFYNA